MKELKTLYDTPRRNIAVNSGELEDIKDGLELLMDKRPRKEARVLDLMNTLNKKAN
jgi:hypothetical protein